MLMTHVAAFQERSGTEHVACANTYAVTCAFTVEQRLRNEDIQVSLRIVYKYFYLYRIMCRYFYLYLGPSHRGLLLWKRGRLRARE